MLTKKDSQMSHGLAILAMVTLHLFCRIDISLYHVRFLIGNIPAIYYLGLFGDMCVPIYCFSSGYAQYWLHQQEGSTFNYRRIKRLFKFLTHYWLVVVFFAFVGVIVGSREIPGGWSELLGNLFLYRLTYNGAWWFVVTYVFLILLCPFLFNLASKINGWLLTIISGMIYFISYQFRFNYSVDLGNSILNWILEQLILLGTSQLSFIIGVLFCKHNIIMWLQSNLTEKQTKMVITIIPCMMFLGHCIVQSLIVAPITGLSTVVCFHLWKKPATVQRLLTYFGKHSTRIWLIHMFFYMKPFTNLVFKAKEPVLVFAFMLALCLATSHIIEGLQIGLRRYFAYMRNLFGKVAHNHELQM